MRSVFCLTALAICLLGATVDSVLLPQYDRWRKERLRAAYDHARSERTEKAKVANPGRTSRKFVPSGNRCCKVGEKTAKKRMSCSSVGIYAAARTFNNNNYVHKAKVVLRPRGVRRFAKVLTSKINKCSLNFSKKFEKCCRMKAIYYRHMKKCKKLKRSERRRCRLMIKRRYRSS